MKVSQKVIVVTGGGNGIGRELVLHLLRKGARVAAVDLQAAALDATRALAGDVGERLSTHVLNIADRDAVLLLPEAVIAKHGSVDGVINCAGIIQPFVRVNDLDWPAIDRVMQVNFYGTLAMVKAFLPHLLKRPEAHIVNVSSMGGFLPVPGQGVYGASKAAVKLLTEALYAELMQTSVKVSVVFPGAVATQITANSGVAAPKMPAGDGKESKIKPLAADKAAAMIIQGMEEDKVRIYVGGDSKFLNTLYRLNPGYATRFISKKMQELLG